MENDIIIREAGHNQNQTLKFKFTNVIYIILIYILYLYLFIFLIYGVKFGLFIRVKIGLKKWIIFIYSEVYAPWFMVVDSF